MRWLCFFIFIVFAFVFFVFVLEEPTYDGAVAATDDEDAGGDGEGDQDLDAVIQHQVAKIVVAGNRMI